MCLFDTNNFVTSMTLPQICIVEVDEYKLNHRLSQCLIPQTLFGCAFCCQPNSWLWQYFHTLCKHAVVYRCDTIKSCLNPSQMHKIVILLSATAMDHIVFINLMMTTEYNNARILPLYPVQIHEIHSLNSHEQNVSITRLEQWLGQSPYVTNDTRLQLILALGAWLRLSKHGAFGDKINSRPLPTAGMERG